MNTKDALKLSIDMGRIIASGYLEDLSDDDLMRRPHPKCNHIKWQLGHLIAGEHDMIETVAPGSMPRLPAGFAERYTKETAASDDPAKFDSKADLLQQFEAQRAGTLAALAKTSDADFDKETGVSYAPTVGAMYELQGSHWVMHAGQWAVVRRMLGRAPLF
ncbi:MAG: DinB family protein [Planctomycetaceae bacterium]|nr:DinB family protein [Planctomycetaceae bacterium]